MVTIDGDEVVSGSTIDGDEISEITMDGDVVWTAVTIPDSAVHRWKLDDVNSTVSDSIGSVSGSVRGVSSVSGDWQGGSAGEGDGSGDEIILTNLSDFDNDLTKPPFSIAFTVETTDGSDVGFFGFENPNRWKIMSGDIGPEGGIDIVFRGDDGEDEQTRTADGGLIDDGNPHRVVCVIPEVDANNFEVYVDADSKAMDVRRDFSSASSFLDGEVALFSENGGAHLNGIMDDVIIYDEAIGQSDVDSDYDSQPWS